MLEGCKDFPQPTWMEPMQCSCGEVQHKTCCRLRSSAHMSCSKPRLPSGHVRPEQTRCKIDSLTQQYLDREREYSDSMKPLQAKTSQVIQKSTDTHTYQQVDSPGADT